jgi:rfaE bifunctional protein nucleotidyltransferase chain/domain
MNKNIILSVTDEESKIIKNHLYIKNEKHSFFDYKNSVCHKLWGHEFLIYQNKKIGLWYLKINNGHKTSLHCHFNKDTIIIVIKGTVKIELINNKTIILNEMDTLFIPHYSFHSLGTFSPESYILEIEIYNNTINFTDKNDLLRIKDIYNRQNNNYETSVNVDVDNIKETYGYFCLDNNFNEIIEDVNFKISEINNENVSQFINNSNINIILEGTIFQKMKFLNEGSIIDSFDNLNFLEDKSIILSLTKFDCIEDSKIIYNNEQLTIISDELKKNNKKIILSSGCFDIIHVGHINNLAKSKRMGDILMICLSSDDQISKLKGIDRPINNYNDRTNLFKTIKYIDYVILYNEQDIVSEKTLGNIMQIIDPYIWVKGSDYKVEDILKKHPYLKNIKLIDNIENKSTTKIIEKILNIK